MSASAMREHSITVRLSGEERAALEALAAQWRTDKSAALRRALVQMRPQLARSGRFVALRPAGICFALRLRGKADDGG